MNKTIILILLVSLSLSACVQKPKPTPNIPKPTSNIPSCINNKNTKETEALIKRFQEEIGPGVYWNDFDKVIPTIEKPYTGTAILQLSNKYNRTTFAKVENYRTGAKNELETTGRNPSEARKKLLYATELAEKTIKSKEREIKAIKDAECTFNNSYRSKSVSKQLAFEVEVFKGLINVTIPNLITEVNKGEEYQQIVLKRKNAEIKQKQIASDKVKNRRASYLANKGTVYKDSKIVIKLIDYTNSTLFISIKNIQKNKILKTNFTKCTLVDTKFGGTECVFVVNGLTLNDQYGNHFRLYASEDRKIYPQEVVIFKFRGDRALDTSNLIFNIPAYTIGTEKNVNLRFPAKTY
ncbi:hypothetical protein JQC92_00760 [Shewanella sp. 202IG2-18]|uniref:hypothetical protein n=1 Tax=Parashewanella hymeniacidonis TaxID=2807618 RepID=UPI0019603721|nr:hypothetical protein [Parashewanella hymeniacidonis]MBM7070576.1 hypothetical protein [Parashewanella hymeniacidonis]